MFGAVNDDWQPCPPGELGHLAERLRARRWAVALLGAAAGLLVAAAVGFSAWQVAGLIGPPFDSATPGCAGTGCGTMPPCATPPDTAP
jgi:hypothetical protein